jgi:hypothetical protein
MAWYLAPALDTLRTQINKRWPDRDRTSDGTIGDAAHSARTSDHNPDPSSSPPGIVRAIDIDEDGIDTGAVILAMLSDARTRYVIYEALIWERVTGKWRIYAGPNLHRHHIHVSVRSVEDYAYDTSRWAIPALPAPPAPPVLTDEDLPEEDMKTVFRRPDGPAFLAWGNKAVGISTGEDLDALEAAGIPVAEVTVALWDKIAAALGGVK